MMIAPLFLCHLVLISILEASCKKKIGTEMCPSYLDGSVIIVVEDIHILVPQTRLIMGTYHFIIGGTF